MKKIQLDSEALNAVELILNEEDESDPIYNLMELSPKQILIPTALLTYLKSVKPLILYLIDKNII